MTVDPKAVAMMLEHMLKPWKEAIAKPAQAQQTVLNSLLTDYAKTRYGQNHNADQIGSLEDYRRSFPIMSYEGGYKP